MIIRKATDADMPAVISLLEEMSLPVDGIAENRDHLYVLEAQGTLVGAVGYEAYPPDALLRSLVIAPSMRGQGYGRQLISHILKQAQIDGIRDAYALTTTIPYLLSRSCFDEISRSDAPEALSASEEFRGACPVSARLFRIPIDSAK
ncbi:GNAT family N-acetyltransferase [bacterium]|nr:GNAT family N-acetyltransferase [bacterium]